MPADEKEAPSETLTSAELRRLDEHLDDNRYAIAQSTLSEYEAGATSPRHLEKAITLCLLYGMALYDFAAALGVSPEHLGPTPMPDRLILPYPIVSERSENGPPERAVAKNFPPLGDSEPIPSFLAGPLDELSGIPRPSPRDFFHLAGDQTFLPAGTEGSFLALVDRRKKKPTRNPGLRSWQQPAWVLLLRNGEYRCACCSTDRKTFVLYPESDKLRFAERLQSGSDVEVIGQVVAVSIHRQSRWPYGVSRSKRLVRGR